MSGLGSVGDLRTAIAAEALVDIFAKALFSSGPLMAREEMVERVAEVLGLPTDATVAAVRQAWERSQAIDATEVFDDGADGYATRFVKGGNLVVISHAADQYLDALRGVGVSKEPT